MEKALMEGAVDKLDKAIDERLKRVGQVSERMPRSIEVHSKVTSGNTLENVAKQKRELYERWPDIDQAFRDSLNLEGDPSQRKAFMNVIEQAIGTEGRDYLAVIKGLGDAESGTGTAWLQGLVDEVMNRIWNLLPAFRPKGQERE